MIGLKNSLVVTPSSWLSLQERQKTEWGDQVQLHFGDMRTLELPEKVDILITELLGSFGDNELSPECLDGAVRFLKREHLCPGFLLFPRLKFHSS